MWALCPYHDDHSVGSFSVHMGTGLFHCFVCGAAGGVKTLLKRLGLWDPDWDRRFSRSVLREGIRAWSDNAARKRGVDFRVMTIPEAVLDPIIRYRPRRYVWRGHSRALLDQLQVCYDPLHQRIVFPVRTAQGQLAGIQSRSSGERTGALRWKWYTKEIEHLLEQLGHTDTDDIGHGPVGSLRHYDPNTYETPRSALFWGEDQVVIPLGEGELLLEDRPLVLVEGMGARLRVLGAGYPCLSTFGARLSNIQSARLLRMLDHYRIRHSKRARICVAFDGDIAGVNAAVSLCMSLQGRALVDVVPLPPGKDPEDMSAMDMRKEISLSTSLHKCIERGGWWSKCANACISDMFRSGSSRLQRRTEKQKGRFESRTPALGLEAAFLSTYNHTPKRSCAN